MNRAADRNLHAIELKQRIAVLERVCAEAYQLAGVVGAPARALDNLDAAKEGEPMPHPTFPPVSAADCGASRNIEPARGLGFRPEGADRAGVKDVGDDYQLSPAICEALRRQMGLGRGFPRFWGVVFFYGVAGSLRWLLAAARRRWSRGRRVAGDIRGVERRVRDLEHVCAEAYQLATVVDAPERALDNLWAAAAGEPIPHETFLPISAADCARAGSAGR